MNLSVRLLLASCPRNRSGLQPWNDLVLLLMLLMLLVPLVVLPASEETVGLLERRTVLRFCTMPDEVYFISRGDMTLLISLDHRLLCEETLTRLACTRTPLSFALAQRNRLRRTHFESL